MSWIGKNRLYFYVFGGLMAVVAVVSTIALSDTQHEGLGGHVWFRTLLHLPWGFVLYALFSRLLLFGERQSSRVCDWRTWNGVLIGLIVAIAVNQEFGFPGDFRHADTLQLRLKSFADLAGWTFGALACAWRDYFMADRLHEVRGNRLEWLRLKRKGVRS